MAISKCISLSAENRIESNFSDAAFHVNETGYHGTPEFPVAVYLDDVSQEYVNWHWHEEFEIGFVTEGSVVLGCGNRKYPLECGDIFFVNSNVLHSMHRGGTSGRAVFKSVAFHGSVISDDPNSVFYAKYLLPILSDRNFREYILPKDSAYCQSMLEPLSKAWELVYSEEPDYEIRVRNELSVLFCLLNRSRQDAKETALFRKSNDLQEKRVQILLDYLHTHYQDKITIEELAKAASISKTEVIRCFKAIMGVPPICYLNSYRLQRAAQMLTHTEKSVQEIADGCGFDDNSYFSKLFRKKYQVSPHDYRLLHGPQDRRAESRDAF